MLRVSRLVQQALIFPSSFAGLPMTIPKERQTPSLTQHSAWSCARVCPVEVLCVGSCVYNDADVPPIQIGKLQRFATDQAFEEGWNFYEAGEDTGKKVALIGGGPASLAAAHRLRRYGHSVTIFERDEQLGGLNTTGVAPYKMKADRSLTEVEWVLSIGGIEIVTGVDVPTDMSWAQLQSDFDAIFIGFGLGRDRYMNLDNADASGIYGAVDYIAKMKLGEVDVSMKQALVVGGGNTAIDAVRELAGIGISNVTMVYRGDEAKMSGYAHEWVEAKRKMSKLLAFTTGFLPGRRWQTNRFGLSTNGREQTGNRRSESRFQGFGFAGDWTR